MSCSSLYFKAMKNQFAQLIFASFLFLLSGFATVPEEKVELPFVISYTDTLKLISSTPMAKYDYMECRAGEDIWQVKQYRNCAKEKAQKIIADRKFFLLAMFKDQPSPYPGVLSNSIGCPKEFQPTVIEDTVAVYLSFKLLATSNLIYGNCNPPDNYYYSTYLLFFCPARNDFFEVKFFTPIKNPSKNYEGLDASLKCKD